MREQLRRFLNWHTALGELVIVIVGVLIALGVDSWWEDRAERLEEAEHLIALKLESEQNLAELYTTLDSLERYADSTRALVRIIEGEETRPQSDSLVRLTWLAFSFASYDPQFTAYENLLNTGGVRLLSDTQLKIELAQFKSAAEGLAHNDWQQDQWNQVIQPWVIRNLQLDWLPVYYRQEHQLPEPRVFTNWDAVLSDQEFKGIVINRVIAFADYKLGLDKILQAAEATAMRLGVDIAAVRASVE